MVKYKYLFLGFLDQVNGAFLHHDQARWCSERCDRQDNDKVDSYFTTSITTFIFVKKAPYGVAFPSPAMTSVEKLMVKLPYS